VFVAERGSLSREDGDDERQVMEDNNGRVMMKIEVF
jgi:hypothetical protein